MAFKKHLFVEGGKMYRVNLPVNSELGRAFDRMAEKYYRAEEALGKLKKLDEELEEEYGT